MRNILPSWLHVDCVELGKTVCWSITPVMFSSPLRPSTSRESGS